jgi:hypothetical protein
MLAGAISEVKSFSNLHESFAAIDKKIASTIAFLEKVQNVPNLQIATYPGSTTMTGGKHFPGLVTMLSVICDGLDKTTMLDIPTSAIPEWVTYRFHLDLEVAPESSSSSNEEEEGELVEAPTEGVKGEDVAPSEEV